MNDASKLAVYQAQVQNTRSLQISMRQVHRCVNDGLRSNDQAKIDTFTKTYALLFCAWAEANFSKVIHTPYGFDVQEIEQVQNAKSQGIAIAWKKAVDLGLRHLDAKRGSFKPNAQQKLKNVIDTYVVEPSGLRNKLAHGQWLIALNRSNDAIQPDLTTQIKGLNIVQIASWIDGHKLTAETVETLIESPKKAFVRDWYQYVTNIETSMIQSGQRTLQQHAQRLIDKETRTGATAKRRWRRQ